MNFLSNMTTSAKVALAMKTLGLSSAEMAALDGIVGSLGSNPLVLMATGREYTCVKDLVVSAIDKSGSVNPKRVALLGQFLANPDSRDWLADLAVKHIAKSDHSEALTSALSKVAQLPISGFHDQSYENGHQLISSGILGYAAHLIENQEFATPLVESTDYHQCPLCDGVYLPQGS